MMAEEEEKRKWLRDYQRWQPKQVQHGVLVERSTSEQVWKEHDLGCYTKKCWKKKK